MINSAQKKGDDFELIIKNIYDQLARSEHINVDIKTKERMLGYDGVFHEIDVLYSYEHIGTIYRVAIECKNWKNPVDVSELRNFYYKLEHIGNINGIFISSQSGFQKGAKKLASFNGIKIIKYSDLDMIIKGNYQQYLKPSFSTIGDPFWMLMNTEGTNSVLQNSLNGSDTLLFDSKYFATTLKKNNYPNDDNVKVVGVSQDHLKALFQLSENNQIRVKLFNQFSSDLKNRDFTFWDLQLKDISMYFR